MSSDIRTLTSTSKGDMVPHTSVLIPAKTNPPVTEPPVTNSTLLISGPFSTLSKLKTYLPTGTWVTYTALQTWAFSINPQTPPTSLATNCNAHQHAALIFVIAFSALLAFSSCFIKIFVYDANGVHVLYPYPDLFNVTDRIADPVMGIIFPCKTKENLYCWPLCNAEGGLVYDEKRERLRVVVFKSGVSVYVRRQMWLTRAWDLCFKRGSDGDERQLSTGPTSQHVIRQSIETTSERREHKVEIDNLPPTAPALQPRWSYTMIGALGRKTYLDFQPRVWAHGLVSGFAFLALALFSTQVCQCLYPSIPDYLPSSLQTGMLGVLSLIATLFLNDNAVSLGQPPPQHLRRIETGGSKEVPEHLRSVVEMLVWVRRHDGHKAP